MGRLEVAMRNRRLSTLILICALTPFAATCSLLQVEQPRVALVDVGLENLGLLQSTLAITLRVDNPNGFRLPIERGVYTLYLGGERVGTGGTRGPLDVPAHASRTEQIVIDFDNLRLLSRLRGLLDGRKVDYRVEADHYVSGLRSQAFRSVAEGELDLARGSARR
jgi:LEA14-like dessication related protein